MWLPEDTEAALEWQAWQQRLCSGCGTPRDESMDEHGPAYEAEPLRCRACEARDMASRRFTEADGDTAGLFFTVSARDRR